MALISFSNVYRSYAAQVVLDGVSLSINRGDRVGLIGRNGSGKSTVLRMIAGTERPERGSVNIQARLRIGQVEQEPRLDGDQTVAEAVLQGCPELVEMEKELRRLEQQFDKPGSDHEETMALYGDLQHEFDRLGGHEFHGKASAVLCGLGLPVETHERRVNVLSGGQKTRLAIAQLLLADPEVMLLDEPTNHLDLEATEWLQAYLQRFSGSLLLVSHDRYLIDAVCDHIIEIEEAHTWAYEGNYSAALRQKAERLERQRETFERQQQQVQKLESFIRRYKAGDRSTQAKSREKALARLDLVGRPREGRSARIHMGHAERSGRDVVRMGRLAKWFGDLCLFRDVDFVVERGDRIGLVGPNGAGKTTLIRMILGQDIPSDGTLSVGTNVHIGYFSQDFQTLGNNRAVIEEIVADSDLDVPAARTMLARFLFTDDEVFKNVGDLSGGERNRVALCKLLLSRPNLLLLDEPTNHLDIATREGLIAALEEFDGTILVASHDRYLLDRITNRILEVAGGKAATYPGNYSEYHRSKSKLLDSPDEALLPKQTRGTASGMGNGRTSPATTRTRPGSKSGGAAASHSPERTGSGKAAPPAAAPPVKLSPARLERQIQELETRLSSLTERMNDPDLYKSADMLTVVEEYDRVRARLESLYEDWTAVSG